jgi:probable phosphoglycerate mutase
VIRHGESETNRAKQWTGWLDVSLTDKGKADAALAGKLLSRVAFDKIYTSDLARAKNTAEIAIPGCVYESTPRLREVNVGNLAGKPLDAAMDSRNQPMNKDGYANFGGESNEEFYCRVATFMKSLEELDCQNVALFCHAGWLRNALDFVVGTRLPRKNVSCNNCAVAVFEYDGSTWKLHSWINLY